MKIKILTIIIILISSYNLCIYSLNLNQTGATLGKKNTETSSYNEIYGGAGFAFNSSETGQLFVPYPDLRFNFFGLQVRYGISDKIENQSLSDTLLYYSPPNVNINFSYTYENAFKYNVYKNDESNFSILHFIGIRGGAGYTSLNFGFSPIIALTTGLKLIGDYKTFFYGFSFRLDYDFGYLTWGYADVYRIPSFEPSFSWGYQMLKENFVMRHEFSIGLSYSYFDTGNSLRSIRSHVLGVYAGYTISFGKRTKKSEEN